MANPEPLAGPATTSDTEWQPSDAVDALIGSWTRQRPELGPDFEAAAALTRLLRLRAPLAAGLQSVFGEYGLTAPDFNALVTLARVSGPEGVSQQRLADDLALTPGTVSVRVDRLVGLGLAERGPDPASKRSTLLALTAAGRDLADRVLPAHLANEDRMLAALSGPEREQLSGLLRKLLVEFEGSRPIDGPIDGSVDGTANAATRIGLVLAPAHVTISMRAAVGLPPVPGLLVRLVEPGSPAAAAGLRPGDVLTASGPRELRSSASLYAAARDAGAGPVPLTVLRGTSPLKLSLELPGPPGPRAAPAGPPGSPPEHVL